VLAAGWLPCCLAQLSQLTSLALLGDFNCGIGRQLQQLLARTLPLRRLEIECRSIDDDVLWPLPNLAHMTRLEVLISGKAPAGALPTQLRSLGASAQTTAPALCIRCCRCSICSTYSCHP
jgi:hypothetical protein